MSEEQALRLAEHREFAFDLEVRYYETDGQGFVHHANYLKYLETARVEQLKAAGIQYVDMEREGYLLVVSKIECRYRLPSRFGDTLRIWLRTERARGARVDHRYRITRGEQLVFEAQTTLACVDRDGNLRRLPQHLEVVD